MNFRSRCARLRILFKLLMTCLACRRIQVLVVLPTLIIRRAVVAVYTDLETMKRIRWQSHARQNVARNERS